MISKEKFEDTKEVIWIRKLTKTDNTMTKRTNNDVQNNTQKGNDRAKRISIKTADKSWMMKVHPIITIRQSVLLLLFYVVCLSQRKSCKHQVDTLINPTNIEAMIFHRR